MVQREIHRKLHRVNGFTMVEVMFAMIIFLMMTLVFAAVFPVAVKSAKYSNNYAQAAMIAQHKLDQIHMAGWSYLTATSLTNQSLVDSGSCASDANSGITCTFTSVDGLADTSPSTGVGYFPAGSTGTLVIDPDTGTGVPTGKVDNVIVRIVWSGGGMPAGSYTAASKVVEMTHN